MAANTIQEKSEVVLAVKISVAGEGVARVHITEENPLSPRHEVRLWDTMEV